MARHFPHPFELPERTVTPEDVYLSRRRLLRDGLALAGGLAAGSAAPRRAPASQPPAPAPDAAPRNARLSVDLPLTPEELASRYNNFYEFGSGKRIWRRARSLDLDGWTLEVGGLVERPLRIAAVDLARDAALEERVYRFRCVETWAMVVPWTGIPLRALLERARPLAAARYVGFESFHRPTQALGQLLGFWYPWPYREGLRLDEAENELVLLATGIYGKPLPPQHGAPLRLVVPWKYGFKSIKSIVRIELSAERPATFWNTIAPDEYPFESNVDPDVAHPRWSQASERLLGSEERQPTLLYNGYAPWVAGLYVGR